MRALLAHVETHIGVYRLYMNVGGKEDMSARREQHREDTAAEEKETPDGPILDLSDAAVVRTSDDARALLAESVADDLGAVGAYIAPVEITEGGKVEPGNLREQIRRSGVTIGLPVQA